MIFRQDEIELSPHPRGCHLVTRDIFSQLQWINEFSQGLVHLHIAHTSASLILNENADPEVRVDMEAILNHLVPGDLPFLTHTYEGADDMPAHAKAALLGSSVEIPINGGRPLLGTWQGIYLCEHRNRGGRRRIIASAWGEARVQ